MLDLTDSDRARLPLLHPTGVYFDGTDALRLTVLNALTGVTVKLTGRFQHVDGRLEAFARLLTPATDRTASTLTFQLGAGWLLNARAVASAASPITGQTFALLSILRGLGSAAEVLGTLVAGYLTAAQAVAWPGQLVQSSLEGRGAIRSVAGTSPAAGAEIAETVPTGARWELLAVKFRLVTDGTVANRRPHVTITDGTVVLAAFPQSTNIAASTTADVSLTPGEQIVTDTNQIYVASGLTIGAQLLAGYKVLTSTSNIAAGDQYSAVRLWVREHFEGA